MVHTVDREATLKKLKLNLTAFEKRFETRMTKKKKKEEERDRGLAFESNNLHWHR